MLFGNITIAVILARAFVLLVAFTIHELAHGVTANYFGDDTPRMNGRLTLNPLRHLDPIGSLLLLTVGFGWAKPMPVNPYALQRHSPAAMMWVSLAGPASNLVLALLAAIPLRLGLVSLNQTSLFGRDIIPTPGYVLVEFIFINLVLMLFNLIPLAPLDGDKILDFFLPASVSRSLDKIRPYGPIILLALVFVGPYLGVNILNYILWLPSQAMFDFLVG